MLYSSTANNRHRESYISRAMVSYLGAHPARGEPARPPWLPGTPAS